MVVIKRDGREVPFVKEKIADAIHKAFVELNLDENISIICANKIATNIENYFHSSKQIPNVETIQDMVEDNLISNNYADVAKAYIKYRYDHELKRNASSFDNKILSIVDNTNETIKQENSNKNPFVLSTQRDYMAGELSRDLANRLLLSPDIVKAHNEGLIHFHDSDYFAQHMHNCCLVNLEDMLQNGTVINGTLVEKPHSFATACNIATQIMAQIASNQYGGQSESLAHLAPFVDISRQKIRQQVEDEVDLMLSSISDDWGFQYEKTVVEITENRVREEIKRGVQTIQYQINTLMTTNGQAPFVTIFMYLGEAKDERTKKDLAMIIEEVVRQRTEGVKNEKGVWITPAFPKLIYVLEEDNIHEDSPYYYLTELCAKCTAKRLVPDYISEKKMLEYKIDKNGKGHCYPCMGCRSFLTPYVDENNKPKYYGRLTA